MHVLVIMLFGNSKFVLKLLWDVLRYCTVLQIAICNYKNSRNAMHPLSSDGPGFTLRVAFSGGIRLESCRTINACFDV